MKNKIALICIISAIFFLIVGVIVGLKKDVYTGIIFLVLGGINISIGSFLFMFVPKKQKKKKKKRLN